MIRFIVFLLMVLGTLAYISFSNPKTNDEKSKCGKDSALFHSSLRMDNYPATEKIFQTLKDAGIEPCFLDASNFTQEEQDLYSKMLERNSEDTGINVFDLMC